MSYCDYDADHQCLFFFDDNTENKEDIQWVASNEKSAPSRSDTVDENNRHIPYINVFAKRRNKKEYKCQLVQNKVNVSNPSKPALPTKSTLYPVPEHSDSSDSGSSSKTKSGDITLPMNAMKVKELSAVKRAIQQQIETLDKLEHKLVTQGLTISNPPNRGEKTQKLAITQPAYDPIAHRLAASGLRSISEPTKVRLPHGYYPNACNVVIGQSNATNYAGMNHYKLNRVQHVQHKVNMMQIEQQRVNISQNIQNVPNLYHGYPQGHGHGVGLQANPEAVPYNYNVNAFKYAHNANVAFPAKHAYQ